MSKLPLHNDYPVVTAVSVSPNGNLLAAAGDDHAIRIISFETGKTISTLVGHLDWVQCVEFSPSGRQLASCGHDGTLCVWSMNETPKLIVENSVGHALLTLSFLNEDRIYTAGFGNNIYRWNSTDRQLIIDHACDCRDIRSITCSRDKTMVAYGGRDGVLRIRSTNDSNSTDPNHSNHSNEIMAPLHFDRIRSIQFSDDSTQITSVGEDRRIVHYDILKRVAIGQTEIGGGKLMGLCQLDNHLFAIAGSDNSIRIFSDVDKRVLVKLVGHDGSVGVLRRTASHIISGSFDTTIRVWDIDRALSSGDTQGRYVHPVAAQFEDSGAGDGVK